MNDRIRTLVESTKGRGPRIGIVSMYDVENNAVRIIAAHLRASGHHVTEIYFKDWISNHLHPPTDKELANLQKTIADNRLDLVCFSIRASAYYQVTRQLTRFLNEQSNVCILWGGMHPTLVPQECIETADMVLKGEGELALTDLADRLRDGEDITTVQNVDLQMEDGSVKTNGLRPLIKDLDDLEYRDYTSHDDKWLIYGKALTKGDPMHGDPVFQMMGSRGCIYKCSYCYNSTYKKDVYPGQKWFRVRSPRSMVDEIKEARKHWDIKRIRFDDEVFNFQKAWLEDFCEIYPREIGLPFEIFIEPKLVSEERMTMLRDAGLVSVYMGIQSSERVTGHLYDRRVKNKTVEDIAQLYHRLGIKGHFQLIFDDPVSTQGDKESLFKMVESFPAPYDLYLFSMTVFPGSELVNKLLANKIISKYDVEGTNTRVFYQHRVNLKYPRPVEDTFWIALIQMQSKSWIPKSALRAASKSEFLKKHPWPLIQVAHGANFIKMGQACARMAVEGELTKTLWRRWANMDTIITT
ncbi:MAG: radical SAM protein [Proteobacteria bacterium]|nr:radical SAM protein [Pseudomonadota bacterium]MCP4916024.1 radical SAM protein [Pseudomonadota bacterium]